MSTVAFNFRLLKDVLVSSHATLRDAECCFVAVLAPAEKDRQAAGAGAMRSRHGPRCDACLADYSRCCILPNSTVR
jgi:hypothetical protein